MSVYYEVQPGFVYKGFAEGMVIELDSVTPEIQTLIDQGVLGLPSERPLPDPDFESLRTAFRGSDVFLKTYAASKNHTPVNSALTLTLDSITAHSLEGLRMGLTDLIQEMSSVDAFNSDDFTQVNHFLGNAFFLFTVDNSGVIDS